MLNTAFQHLSELIKEFNDSTEIKPLYALTCAQRDRPNGS